MVLVLMVKSRGWKRQVCPFQWTPAPPIPVPGSQAPSCRIGSAGSFRLCLNVHVSLAVFWKRSLRIAQLVVVVLELFGAAIVAALEPHDGQPCLGQLGGDDAADPTDSDDRNVDFLVRHGYIPPIDLLVSAFAGFLEPVAAALDATPAFAYFGMSGSGLSAYGYVLLVKM